jgi:predicted nucleotidyltransferase
MKVPSEPVNDLVACFLEEVERRMPGELTGLFLHGSIVWGEFFPGSDIDFVAVWEQLPAGERLDELEEAHARVKHRFPSPAFDGFHCTAADLAASPATIEYRPVFYEGAFNDKGTIDINLVTWHELALGPVVIRGQVPDVYTSLPELLDFTRTNLDTYWRGTADQVKAAGVKAVGEQDDAVAWIALGAARLHHLLSQRTLTSKSGAGRYIIERLDARWAPIAQEALRIRERPDTPSLYIDHGERGQDTYDLLVWLVEDGLTLRPQAEGERDAVVREGRQDVRAHALRSPGWDGARNAADLGGLPLVDGGTTAHGRVWRSAAPEWMTAAGWQAARAAGLTCVIDLRNDAECGRRPEHPVVDERVIGSVTVVRAPTEDPDDPDFLEECGPWLDHPRSWAPNARRYPEKFAHIFSAIAATEGSALIHCAGGRDRTGMVASMLLAVAGVEAAAIAANYEDGFRGAGAHRGHGLGYDPATGEWVEAPSEEWSPAELDEAMADRIPALLQWLQETDVEAYLLNAGVDVDSLARLRQKLRD